MNLDLQRKSNKTKLQPATTYRWLSNKKVLECNFSKRKLPIWLFIFSSEAFSRAKTIPVRGRKAAI